MQNEVQLILIKIKMATSCKKCIEYSTKNCQTIEYPGEWMEKKCLVKDKYVGQHTK